jgi:hypothetical protein
MIVRSSFAPAADLRGFGSPALASRKASQLRLLNPYHGTVLKFVKCRALGLDPAAFSREIR